MEQVLLVSLYIWSYFGHNFLSSYLIVKLRKDERQDYHSCFYSSNLNHYLGQIVMTRLHNGNLKVKRRFFKIDGQDLIKKVLMVQDSSEKSKDDIRTTTLACIQTYTN